MDFTALGRPELFHLFGWLGLAFLAWRWLRSGDWRSLADSARLNLFLGATVAVLVLWQVRFDMRPGLSLHLYGISVLTLMFGVWRAGVAGVLVLLGQIIWGGGQLAALGLDAMLRVALPATMTWSLLRLAQRWLPRHFFIYVMGSFFSAAVAVATIGLAVTVVMVWSGTYSLAYLLSHYLPYATLLLGWAGASLTGMAINRPAWLETFDDRTYLDNA